MISKKNATYELVLLDKNLNSFFNMDFNFFFHKALGQEYHFDFEVFFNNEDYLTLKNIPYVLYQNY